MMSPPLAAGPSGSMAVTRSAPAAGCRVSPIPVRGGILVVGRRSSGAPQGAPRGDGGQRLPAPVHTRVNGERLPGAYWSIAPPAADPFPTPRSYPRAPPPPPRRLCAAADFRTPIKQFLEEEHQANKFCGQFCFPEKMFAKPYLEKPLNMFG